MTGQLDAVGTAARDPIDPDGVHQITSGERQRWWAPSWITWVALALAPAVLFVLLRPDWYYLQNGLDPYFYTGYAQNFDDVLQLGAKHYFVTRWSLYLPQVYLVALFGPVGGFMVFRALLAAVIVACLYVLARRWWNTATLWLLVVVTLCSPLLLRPLFSDYSDAVYVPMGIAIITLLALWPSSPVAGAAAGVTTGLAVAANPVAVTIALSALGAWFFVRQSWRRRMIFAGSFGAGFIAVIVASALWFRVRYGLDELYQPTVEFLRARAGTADAIRSPRLLWLGYYLWIYLPGLVLLTALWLHKRRGWRMEPGQRMILATCALQYAFQIWSEFARKGTTLEAPFYWSYMVPSLLLATAVVIGQLAKEVPARHVAILAGGIVVILLIAPSPFPSATSWMDLAIVIGVAGYIGWRLLGRHPIVALAVVAATGIFVPLMAPAPLPLAAGEQNVPASYNIVFHATDSGGQDAFDAVEWWITEANAFGDDVERSMYFWIGGGHGHRLAAAYLAHVSGRWLNAGWGNEDFLTVEDATWDLLETCQLPYLALVGAPADVDQMLAVLRSRGVPVRSIFDGTAPSEVVTRANVVQVGPCPPA